MSTVIMMVPVHLDGYFLSQDRLAVEAFANFENLPFSDGTRDFNPDTANLSESILSVPLQDNNFTLGKGLHLHWSLPDALTKGGSGGSATDFHAVPNRWLIKRSSPLLGDFQRVVESDFLNTSLENTYNAISYPIDPVAATGQPYGYLGRHFNLLDWQEDPSAQRISRLTAVGYGDPAFAAFYPSCHSVFGCFDPDVDSLAKTVGLSYQVIGWYSDSSQDPLLEMINGSSATNNAELIQAIQEQFSWNVNLGTDDVIGGMVCFSELTLDLKNDFENNGKSTGATISVGNSGTEALSAFLAQDANTENDATARIKLEEQMENLFLQSQLASSELDLGARFLEARHEKGFVGSNGGLLYEIHPNNSESKSVDINLPPGLESALSAVNLAQKEVDQAAYSLAQSRQILFADWSKYMVCAYPPNDAHGEYPDVDSVKRFIQTQDIPAIQEAAIELGRKQLSVTPLLSELNDQINRFNHSTVESSILFQDLTPGPVSSPQISLDNVTWTKSLPFAPQAAVFNGSNADLTIDLDAAELTSVQAISMWVNLSTQNGNLATLLATDQLSALISKAGVADFFSKIVIDGVEQPGNAFLSWSSIPKDRWVYLYLEFSAVLDDTDTLSFFSAGGENYAGGKLGALRLFNSRLSEDEIYYDQNMLQVEGYSLQQVSGPKFWQPAEPVLLIEGAAVKPTLRHGADGRMNADQTLDCSTTVVTNLPLDKSELSSLQTVVQQGNSGSGTQIGYATQTLQPWNPFLLEWEVAIHPMSSGGNLNLGNKGFDSDFLTGNYDLAENSPELTVQDGTSVIQASAICKGRSILTPYAKNQLLNHILSQLNGLLESDCYQVLGTPSKTETDAYSTRLKSWFANKQALTTWFATDADYDTQMLAFESWYLNKPVYDGAQITFQEAFTVPGSLSFDSTAARLSDFNYALIKAYQQARSSNFISQALSGLNNALLMHQQTLQLPVSDPLGFEDYRAFTQQVSEYIAGNNNLAALPMNDFLPIRSGIMRIAKLRLVDSFGQSKDLEINELFKANPLEVPATPIHNVNPDDTWLPPRLVQPTRLNVRWLSANTGSPELNSHPDSTPICGWLLANNLDNSLDVYHADGYPIGVIDQEARWRSVPGTDEVVNPKNIENETLRKVVERLALVYQETDVADRKRDFLQDFISTTDAALENIDPDSFVHHQDLALLMGRPIAIVRTRAGLEVKGNLAIHHGWTEFNQDLNRNSRDTDALEEVMIPVRIGERGQLNDGVLGYWQEGSERDLAPTFYTTADASSINNAAIQGYEDAPLDLSLKLKGEPATLTVLLDPRGDLHASTGLLPIQSLSVPKSMYAEALKRINITFLTAPVLTTENQIDLPLPNELGYEWSWLAKDGFNWVEVANQGILRKDTVLKTFSNGESIWAELLSQNWIQEIDGNRARIVSADQRSSDGLRSPINTQELAIEALLDGCHILPPSLNATFKGKQVLQEGWLKLSPDPDQ